MTKKVEGAAQAPEKKQLRRECQYFLFAARPHLPECVTSCQRGLSEDRGSEIAPAERSAPIAATACAKRTAPSQHQGANERERRRAANRFEDTQRPQARTRYDEIDETGEW